MHRRTTVTIAAATAGLSLAAALTGCTSTATTAPEPTVTRTVVASPGPAPTVTTTPMADTATLLKSAPVPAACRHPAGTLVNGVLPGQPASSGEVELSSLIDSGAGPYQAAGSVTGIDGTAVAASITCNAGGVPWPDVIAIYRLDGSALTLAGSYSLGDFNRAENAVTSSVSISGGQVTVDWTGPATGQPAADGSNRQSARFTIANGEAVPTGYTHSA